MAKTAIFTFIILFLCISCGENKSTGISGQQPKPDSISFYHYCEQMPKVKLPMTVHLFYESVPAVAFDLPADCPFPSLDSAFRSFDEFAGVVSNSQQFTSLLFTKAGDDIIPILVSFDRFGKRIGIQSLYPKNIGAQGPWSTIYGTTIIESDLHITLLDSGWSYDLDSAYNRIDSTFSRHRQDFQIDHSGNVLELIE